ncbi:MAG: MtnX-like HAD-IB family phosphatase [Candidatus Kapabacteria bacterium]|nr:MtnX-like HAD-IB family phosphatase [Candidatus Kapabacteria bacterium]
MKQQRKIQIFTDFDGTITLKDIGDELFKDFGIFEPYHSQLVKGKLKIDDYWNVVFMNLRAELNKQKIAEYAQNFEIDKSFLTFFEFCKENQIDLFIVSDGYEEYIKPVLEKYNIDTIRTFCNRMIFNDNGKILPEFVYASESCNCLSASCKRNMVLTKSEPESILIYIGDGASDFCPAQYCDLIFAKKNLAKFCNDNKIPHHPFKDFYSIYLTLKNLISKKKLKTRNQAKILRKKAFEIE